MKVISGGQFGVDIAALKAARDTGHMTGGWMPKGWLTQFGPRPGYKSEFLMEECMQRGYPARTRKNIEDANATLILCLSKPGVGTRLTIRLCTELDVPFFVVEPRMICQNVLDWFDSFGTPAILNVAGPRETGGQYGSLERKAYLFLRNLFEEVKP